MYLGKKENCNLIHCLFVLTMHTICMIYHCTLLPYGNGCPNYPLKTKLHIFKHTYLIT